MIYQSWHLKTVEKAYANTSFFFSMGVISLENFRSIKKQLWLHLRAKCKKNVKKTRPISITVAMTKERVPLKDNRIIKKQFFFASIILKHR